MMFNLLWVLCWGLPMIMFDRSLGTTEKNIENEENYNWTPIGYPGKKTQNLQDNAIFLTNADNLLEQAGKSLNSSEMFYIKGYALKPLKTPNPSHVNLLKANNSVYAETDIKTTRRYQEQRKKRGVFNLYNMVSCSTGCNPLSYMGYGCYCGFLGSGYAVDGIDRCCQNHDWCYDRAKCPVFLQYIVPYYWKCYYNRPICAIDHAEYGGPGSCASMLCECDRILSECLSQYPCPSSRVFCKSSTLRLFQNAFKVF